MRASILAIVLIPVIVSSGCGGDVAEAKRLNEAGVRLYDQGQLEEAIAEYDEAIRLDPQASGHYNNRGLAYYDLNEYRRAIEDYDEAIRLDPSASQTYNNRGLAYHEVREYRRAIQDYDEAILADAKRRPTLQQPWCRLL